MRKLIRSVCTTNSTADQSDVLESGKGKAIVISRQAAWETKTNDHMKNVEALGLSYFSFNSRESKGVYIYMHAPQSL